MRVKSNFLLIGLGFITVMTFFLSLQQLAPFVGNNMLALSLQSIIFLFSMALGFSMGERYAVDREKHLKHFFLMISPWVGVGLSYLFIEQVFYWTLKQWHFPFELTLISYLLVVVAPLAYFLGICVPISIK